MFVYVLRSEKDNSLCVGSTKDIAQRLTSHNKGKNLSTKSKKPWLLVRTEEYSNTSLALKREMFLKTAKGRGVLKNLLGV